MVFHMKTTINIADDLFVEAKKLAVDRRITLTALFDEALKTYVRGGPTKKRPFRLADGSFKGELGLQPGIDIRNWSQIREIIYEDREP
jgi:hypothetical protein